MAVQLLVSNLSKNFTMHLRGGSILPVLSGANFALDSGKCSVLGGPSGVGKSSILKMLYGNYAIHDGQVLVKHRGAMTDLSRASPREIISIRRETIGYVSQFLSVVPRVSTLDIVAGPLVERAVARDMARARAEEMLALVNLPRPLWNLPPATFSGGERQRVNIARGFITEHPVLLLDEPTASLDAANREVVIGLIEAKKAAGVALLGIFHDEEVRGRVADAIIDVTQFAPKSQAA